MSRHARATKVELHAGLDDTGEIKLRIQDNGCGFDVKSQAMGMGLRNMRTRIEELNGRFDITSAPGEGTILTISLPLPDPAAERWTSHVRRVFAAIVICIPVTALMAAWPGSWPYLLPIVLISLGVMLYHVVMRGRVETANPHLIRHKYHLPLAVLWGILLTLNLFEIVNAESLLDRNLVLTLVVELSLLLTHIAKWKRKKA